MLSFIVVTYNSETFIKECLQSIFDTVQNTDYEIIIKDNNSKDSTVKIIKDFVKTWGNVRIIESDINNGFGGGSNDAAKHSSAELLFLLNPDTALSKYDHDSVMRLLDSDKTISIIQPKIRKMLYPDIVESTGHYIDILGNAYIENENAPNNRFVTKRIFAATGASLIVRRDIFDQLSGFDGDYFLLYDETDLWWRNNLLGYKAYYLDDIEVYHFGGGSRNGGIERGRKVNYEMTYFYLRNRIVSGIKNIREPDLLSLFVFGNVSLYIASSFYWLARFDFRYFRVLWKSLFFTILNLSYLMKKRIQNTNIVKSTNKELIDSKLIADFHFKKWLKKVLAFYDS